MNRSGSFSFRDVIRSAKIKIAAICHFLIGDENHWNYISVVTLCVITIWVINENKWVLKMDCKIFHVNEIFWQMLLRGAIVKFQRRRMKEDWFANPGAPQAIFPIQLIEGRVKRTTAAAVASPHLLTSTTRLMRHVASFCLKETMHGQWTWHDIFFFSFDTNVYLRRFFSLCFRLFGSNSQRSVPEYRNSAYLRSLSLRTHDASFASASCAMSNSLNLHLYFTIIYLRWVSFQVNFYWIIMQW